MQNHLMVPRAARWLFLFASALFPRSAPAQTLGRVQNLGPGRLLVASRDLPDPTFAETVILLTQFEDQGAVGLILNRPTKITLSKLFQDSKQAKGWADPAYLGGPVQTEGVQALLRSNDKQDDMRRVLPGVLLITTRAALDKAAAAKIPPESFRVYVGYAGWGPGQLEHEVELGAWLIARGDPALVFDPEPASVWLRMIRRTEGSIARHDSFSGPSIPSRTSAAAAYLFSTLIAGPERKPAPLSLR
jgi:putative transcriptional regulator